MPNLADIGLKKNLYKEASAESSLDDQQSLAQQITNITNQVSTVAPGTLMQNVKLTGVCTLNSQNMPRIFWGASDVLPAGWSITNPSTGNYTITHNLGAIVTPILTAKNDGTINVAVASESVNAFSVVTKAVATGANTNSSFYIAAFIL